MDDLITWLRAQVDEDERHFNDPKNDGYCDCPAHGPLDSRVEAECNAKRQIIEECQAEIEVGSDLTSGSRLAKKTLRAYGAMYAARDRDGYRPEWSDDADDD